MKNVRHIVIAKEPGRFYGWPANIGMWSWGDEILAGVGEAYHLYQGENHSIDRSRPGGQAFGRSYDGGETWTLEHIDRPRPDVEALKALAPFADHGGLLPPHPGGLDFTAPDFAILFSNSGMHYPARSWFLTSSDRGRTWDGPWSVPQYCMGMSMRTDVLALDKSTLLVGMTGSRGDGREGICFSARLEDGGARWTRLGTMGEEIPNGFRIMPSTCRLGDGSLLAVTRCSASGDDEPRWSRLECFRSFDGGASWTPSSVVGAAEARSGGGNPPALCGLADGRAVLVYGKRDEPRGMIAQSTADGVTWTEPYYLRQGAEANDLGYPRMVIRPDGKTAVAVYYYNTNKYEERSFEATIFEP